MEIEIDGTFYPNDPWHLSKRTMVTAREKLTS